MWTNFYFTFKYYCIRCGYEPTELGTKTSSY
jgi:hypothetical protein